MNNLSQTIVHGLGKRALAGMLLVWAAGIGGCVASAPYYYRARLVYTPEGPVYVRERVYYDDPAYYPPPPPPPPPAEPAESPAVAQLHPLVAPIALYPDPLIAVLLPAATFPQQLQDANAWLAANPQPPQSAIDAQTWDASVKAIVHYPTVLTQLTNDIQWTQSLGSAFSSQPADVMAAIQSLRAQAAAQGNLINTPQQVVVQDAGVIAIEPANPAVVYVPTYDPVVVYGGHHPLLFGEVAFATGPWFVDGCDWGGGAIFVGDWHGGYYYREGHWGRDYAFRVNVYHHWERDRRFGPPPHIERAHYAVAYGVRGREAEIHRTMSEHATQRYTSQHPNRAPQPRETHPAQRERPGGH
jgi:hypothetical protein